MDVYRVNSSRLYFKEIQIDLFVIHQYRVYRIKINQNNCFTFYTSSNPRELHIICNRNYTRGLDLKYYFYFFFLSWQYIL